ncbi:MAG: hypothetical protein PUK40_04410 [Actinomycetaceae bacterium]|nr:hypothetical protein [Arcanobacterium sp.]MDD7505175.1 hypothetical protein [Actinomycetaceae bacterium]
MHTTLVSPSALFDQLVNLGTSPALVWYGESYRQREQPADPEASAATSVGESAAQHQGGRERDSGYPKTGAQKDAMQSEGVQTNGAHVVSHWIDADPSSTHPERIELSGKVLADNIAKAANYLVNDAGVEPEDTVLLDLPPHWKTLVWAIAVGLAGAKTVTSCPYARPYARKDQPGEANGTSGVENKGSDGVGAELPSTGLALQGLDAAQGALHGVTSEPAAFVGACERTGVWPESIAALSLESLGFSWRGDLPSGVDDAAAAAIAQPDGLTFEASDSFVWKCDGVDAPSARDDGADVWAAQGDGVDLYASQGDSLTAVRAENVSRQLLLNPSLPLVLDVLSSTSAQRVHLVVIAAKGVDAQEIASAEGV